MGFFDSLKDSAVKTYGECKVYRDNARTMSDDDLYKTYKRSTNRYEKAACVAEANKRRESDY